MHRRLALFPVALVFLGGCFEPTPDTHRIVIDGDAMLVSEIAQDELYRENPQFERDAKAYLPDPEAISDLKEITIPTEFVVFLGNWSSDSQSEIPKFLKVVEVTDNPNFRVTVYGLERMKRDASGDAIAHRIVFVPTIVLYRAGKELGRIVEFPEGSMESNLLDILHAHSE